MLLAELHGKRVPEAAVSEDYLTSAVFGALRFQAFHPFWSGLLKRARLASDPLLNLFDLLQNRGIFIENTSFPTLNLWRAYEHDEPDLELDFRTRSGDSLRLMIEVKLYSGKSTHGPGRDQPSRYLNLLMKAPANCDALHALIYLTCNTNRLEMLESLRFSVDPERAGRLLFGLSWRDVQSVAAATAAQCLEATDVAEHIAR